MLFCQQRLLLIKYPHLSGSYRSEFYEVTLMGLPLIIMVISVTAMFYVSTINHCDVIHIGTS